MKTIHPISNILKINSILMIERPILSSNTDIFSQNRIHAIRDIQNLDKNMNKL